MTGAEIIEAARLNFGEKTALSLEDADFQIFVNKAIQEVYQLLPNDQLRNLWAEGSLAISNGLGSIDAAWDRIVSVSEGDSPLLQVTPEMIRSMDISAYFEPLVSVWAVEIRHLWIRPSTILSVDVTHISPPDELTSGDFANEVTAINSTWHPAIIALTTAYAYAQEEDSAQADLYHTKAMTFLSSQIPQEASAE